MEHDKEISSIKAHLEAKRLGVAIEELQSLAYAVPKMVMQDEVAQVASQFQLLSHYWQQGQQDPQREDIFNQILAKTAVLMLEAKFRLRILSAMYLSQLRVTGEKGAQTLTPENVRLALEEFAQDLAMSQLTQPSDTTEINERRYRFLQKLFVHIITCSQWDAKHAIQWLNLVCSPTIEATDRQMIVSAITLSAMAVFDMQKLTVLAKTALADVEEGVRQRAIIGFVLSTDDSLLALFPEQKRLASELAGDERMRETLQVLQMQLILCATSETEQRTINEELVPSIVRDGKVKISKDGIEEEPDNELEDLLNPEADDERMSRLEENIMKMHEMMNSGVDVYFNGFRHMKRIPYFNNIANWFTAFTFEHPDIRQNVQQCQSIQLIKKVLKHSPFCDSDRYSFVYAMSTAMGMIKGDMREAIESGAAMGEMSVDEEEKASPDFIRRSCLQDMFRFCNLFSFRQYFPNPFASVDNPDSRFLFFGRKVWAGTGLTGLYADIAPYMIKRGMGDEAWQMLTCKEVFDSLSPEGCNVMANLAMQRGDSDLAVAQTLFGKIRDNERYTIKALYGLMRVAARQNRFDEALERYAELDSIYLKAGKTAPQSIRHLQAVCLLKGGKTDEALTKLFALTYENPDKPQYSRTLAEALTLAGRYAEALKIYDKLQESRVGDDLINGGICYWLSGNIAKAAECFALFVGHGRKRKGLAESRNHTLIYIIEPNKPLLERNGIGIVDQMLMADFVAETVIVRSSSETNG